MLSGFCDYLPNLAQFKSATSAITYHPASLLRTCAIRARCSYACHDNPVGLNAFISLLAIAIIPLEYQ
jgi:hypothetical protein